MIITLQLFVPITSAYIEGSGFVSVVKLAGISPEMLPALSLRVAQGYNLDSREFGWISFDCSYSGKHDN